jgi:hypothetical protein
MQMTKQLFTIWSMLEQYITDHLTTYHSPSSAGWANTILITAIPDDRDKTVSEMSNAT